MNAPDPIRPTWTFATTESIKTGTWRAALPRHIHAPSPCRDACPVNGDIAEWIAHARAGEMRRAFDTLARHNPFPAIAGRVCHHPCETACNRGGYDEAISICKLERYVGDSAIAERWGFEAPPAQRRESIAIVGGGPSGLSAAFQLRRRGYAVSLYEARPELGGLMRYGIPAYRLPRDVLDAEIARIVALGVTVHCGVAVDSPAALAALRAEHDAVYVAPGAQRTKRLPVLDYTQPWVVDGADYLARASIGDAPALGERVVVIGGGSAALDVARSVRRRGHAVTILALETERQMPAQREEVVEALEEGIALADGAMLRGVSAIGGAGLRLDCVRVAFQPGARRGEFTLTPIDGSAFALDADAIVSAIGQDPDLSALAPALDAEGALLKTDAAGATSGERVWAGGDVASMARFVTEAVGMGKRAALAIHRHFSGEGTNDPFDAPRVPLSAISLFYHPQRARAAEQRLAADERLASSAEVQLALEVERALAESERCFSCGTCIHCDNCITYCPDLAIRRAGDGYEVLDDYCKGCGACVAECPTGSMLMEEERR